jgi:hypothetical protein
MERIPSFGLAEFIILAIAAGLILLVGAAIVAVVVTRRRKEDSQKATPRESEGASRSWRGGKWMALIVLLALLALPLCVVLGGVLVVTPVRRTMVQEQGAEAVIQEVALTAATVALPAMSATPGAAPTPTPLAMSAPSQSGRASSTGSVLLSLDPFDPTAIVILIGLAGLVLLLGVAVVVAVGQSRKPRDIPLRDVELDPEDRDIWSRTKTLRYVLLALVSWVALSAFLVLDLFFSVSLYWQFVVIYAAFWLLVGALLLVGSPRRDKLLVLGLVALVLFAVRFVDWNSRKPFLKDLDSIREGMTLELVDQIMAGYMREAGVGPLDPETQTELDAQGRILTGSVTYRHTNEGWGNSDWGVVIFEDGRVVQTRFLPD